MNNSPAGTGDWQTEACFKKYANQSLALHKQGAESALQISCISMKGRRRLRDFRYLSYWLAHETHKEYTGLDFCMAAFLGKEAELIKAKRDRANTAKAGVSTAMNAAADAIKAAKTMAWAAREAACKLEACIEDSCNADQLSALSALDLEPKGSEDLDLSVKELFKALVAEIVETAKLAYEDADEAFEQHVKTAGILALLNFDNINERVDELCVDMTGLKDDVSNNIGNVSAQLEAFAEDYHTALAEWTGAGSALSTAYGDLASLDNILEQAEGLGEPSLEDCANENYSDDLKALCDQIDDLMLDGLDCPE